MIDAVLDSSALLALLLREPGAEKVRAVLNDAAITLVNWAEVISLFARNQDTEADIRLMLDPLPVQRIVFDEELAYAAGMLLPATKPAGLSLGDRACLALAQRERVRVLTADRVWKSIAGAVGIEVEVIR